MNADIFDIKIPNEYFNFSPSQSCDTRDGNAEYFSVYAAIEKSPSKVLNAHDLESWENDFTRLPDEITRTYCSPLRMVSGDGYREVDHGPLTIVSDSSSTDYTLDLESATFCFHCFNHVCHCRANSSPSSVVSSVEDNSKLCFL
jgi:hypothetical protein